MSSDDSTSYFTFGQQHFHKVGLITVDRNTVIKITAWDPRHVMETLFGAQWSSEYSVRPDPKIFPGPVIEFGEVTLPQTSAGRLVG